MNILKQNHNLFKVKKELLILNLFIFLLNIKPKLFKNLLMFQVIQLLIELLFNPFLKQFVKKFKFKIKMKLEKNFNLFIDLSNKLIILMLRMYKYLLIMYIDKKFINLLYKEKMLILEFWIHQLKFIMVKLKLYHKKFKKLLELKKLVYQVELLLIKQLDIQLLLMNKLNYNIKKQHQFIEQMM